MSLPLGRTNNKSGRPKGTTGALHANTIMGSLNTRTMERLRDAYERDDTLLTPLHIFFMVMNGQTMDGEPLLDAEGEPIQFDWKTKLAAADKASAFYHTKLPQSVELSGTNGGPIQISNSTAHLEDILFGEVISLEAEDVEFSDVLEPALRESSQALEDNSSPLSPTSLFSIREQELSAGNL